MFAVFICGCLCCVLPASSSPHTEGDQRRHREEEEEENALFDDGEEEEQPRKGAKSSGVSDFHLHVVPAIARVVLVQHLSCARVCAYRKPPHC